MKDKALGKSHKSKPRRSAIACKHCNERRVRCDASSKGFPCSSCTQLRLSDCELIKSKRSRFGPLRAPIIILIQKRVKLLQASRGRTGRFVSALDVSGGPQPTGSPIREPRQPSDKQMQHLRATMLKTQRPEFLVDLKTLFVSSQAEAGQWLNLANHGEDGHKSPISLSASSDQTRKDSSICQKPSFPGESWYLSFILQNTNNDYGQLHEPINNARTTADGTANAGTGGCSGECTDDDDDDDDDDTAMDGLEWPGDLPRPESRNLLVKAYFERFHAFCPMIQKSRFLNEMKGTNLSIPLLRAVLFVSSIHCDARILYRMGYETRNEAGDDLFAKAKADFDNGMENDRVTMLQISFLLHYWWGHPTSFKDSTWWLSGAINAAQSMGMNRSTQHSHMSPVCKKIWRRIWWLLYIRDRQVSISLGKPRIINDQDCDIEELDQTDFWDEPTETALYVMSQARLSIAASNILSTFFSPSNPLDSTDPRSRSKASESIESIFARWFGDLPTAMKCDRDKKNHHLTIGLHINCYYYQIILHQKVQRASTDRFVGSEESAVILKAAHRITSLVQDIIMGSEIYLFPMTCVSAMFASMTVQFVESHTADAQQSCMLQSGLRSNLLGLRQFEEFYSLAGWIRNLFSTVIRNNDSSTYLLTQGQKQDDEGVGTTDLARKKQCLGSLQVPAAGAEMMNPVHKPSAAARSLDPLHSSQPGTGAAFMAVAGAPDGRSESSVAGISSGQLNRDNELLSNDASHGTTPQPNRLDAFQYPAYSSPAPIEALHYLADLGMAGFNDYYWDFPDLTPNV